MKRKLFLGLAGLAIMAAVAVVTVSTINANTPELSDLMSQNIEALTQDETGVGGGSADHNLERYAVSGTCNVPLNDKGTRKCKVTIISCQGRGYGCTPQRCPLHNHD